MLTMTPQNGRPQRKQLCEQLDRLDTILDGLGDALNESVADAVRTGTRLAIKEAIIEILTDPNLRLKLLESAANQQTVSARKPGLLSRLVAKSRQIASAIRRKVSCGIQSINDTMARGIRVVHDVANALNHFGNLKTLATIGIAVGLAVGAGSYFSPHGVAAAVSGIGSGIAAISVQVGMLARRAFRAVSMF